MQNDMKKWIMLMCAFVCSQAMAQDDFESLGGVRLGMTDNEAEQVMAANGMKQTVTKGHRVFYEGNEVELYGVFFNKACIEGIGQHGPQALPHVARTPQTRIEQGERRKHPLPLSLHIPDG